MTHNPSEEAIGESISSASKATKTNGTEGKRRMKLAEETEPRNGMIFKSL